LAGFGAGAAVVAWVTRGRKGTPACWPRRIMLCLVGEVALLAVGAGFWAAFDGAPGRTARNALQCGLAAAMGAQAGAMVAAGRAASPTTYLTGTPATYIVHGLGSTSKRPDGWVPLRLGAVIAGAAAAMALLRTAPTWAGMLPCVLITAAALIAWIPFPTTRGSRKRTTQGCVTPALHAPTHRFGDGPRSALGRAVGECSQGAPFLGCSVSD
jgi:hypothetical protein